MTETAPTTVDQYIAGFHLPVRQRLEAIRAVIRQAGPSLVERMAWQMPTYRGRRNVVHFAAFKDHISLFPGPDAVAAFTEELDQLGLPHQKGTIRLPNGLDLPLDLVRRVTELSIQADQAR